MSSKSAATKFRILEVARELFNEHGTAAISTNRVAAEAGISPGNLYYHFADKKAIIRGLLAEMVADYEQRWASDGDDRANLAALRESLMQGARTAWRYRFFGREMVALLRADSELADSYGQVYRRRLAQWQAFGETLAAQGLLRPPAALTDLTIAIWLIAEHWITFLDITGDPTDPAQVARQADLVLVVLRPYLTPKARRLWKVDLS